MKYQVITTANGRENGHVYKTREAAKVADVARVWLLCCCLTAAAPAAADSIETDTPADVCELLTADPLAQVAEFAAAGLTVSHVTIKSLPARELPAADVPALLPC